MSKTITIECREKSSGINDNTINGTYTTTLPQGIPIVEGDIIQFKSAYIDSVAKSDNKIVLTPDDKESGSTLDCSLTCCYYSLNFEKDNKIYMDDPNNATITHQPDGKTYFITNTQAVADMAGVSQITSMDFGGEPDGQSDTWGFGSFTLQYPDPSSLHPAPFKTKTISLTLPGGLPYARDMGVMNLNGNTQGKHPDGTDKNPNFGKIPFSFRDTDANGNPLPIDRNNFVLISPSQVGWEEKPYYMAGYAPGTGDKSNFSPNINISPLTGNGQSNLYERTFNFTLDTSSAYAPEELARTITDKLARLNNDMSNIITGIYPSDNSFLLNQRRIRTDITVAGGVEADQKVYLFAEDGSNYYNYDLNAADYMIGADQMALTYDTGNSKFNFQAIHTPYYGADGKIDTRFIQNTNLNSILLINKSMGVCLTAMTPFNLWNKALGFQSSILVHPSTLNQQVLI